ncbi:Secreted protein OS=Streptomyces glaucescens OX=1907 GN=SGLAU_16955 PE=4 SV=1 [Streptomyces glaucescens]
MAEAADIQGTCPSPARRWLLRTGALLAGAPLLAGLFQLPTAPTADAVGRTSAKAASDSRTVAVALDSLSPAVPTDGDTLTVSGTVTNNGKETITDAQVDLSVGPELTARSDIDTAAKNTGYVPGADGTEVGGDYTQEFSKLTPGVSERFSISVPVDELDLGDDGVYQFGVSLTGETAAQPWGRVLGFQRTFLPWQPDEAEPRTKTTFLWPLISTARVTAETGSNEQQTPVFLNDDLAEEIAPGGRLAQMLALGKNLDVTWVIDPDLLASVDAMTRGYEVQDGDDTRPGRQQAVAKQWLAELQKAVADKEVVALPFADPDLASLAHNGTDVTGSLSQYKAATDVAALTVESILHVKPSTDFAWPVDGAVDPSIVKVATSAGADRVIARSDSLQETSGLSYTPSAARPIGGGTTAVVADARLSRAFEGDLTKASAGTLAVQRFLAQSLALNLQTGKQRSIVVAPQRMPTASQARAMAEAVTALQGGTWTETQELTTAAEAKPDPEATTKVPSASSYPRALRKQELPREAFEQIARTQAKLDDFKVILTFPSRVVTPFGRAINREMSTSWHGRPAEARSYRDGVEGYLRDLTEQVKLIQKSETKLSGRSATIPVSVQNNLVQGVDHLVLRLTSTSPTRLEIGGKAYYEQPVTVSGGHSQSVKFTTSANANGRVAVVAQLFTQDGKPYGEAVQFDVKVTEITATVMLVIGGGVLLLVLAGFRMYTQRKRAAARETEAEGQDRADAAADADQPADMPENPDDPGERPGEESATRAGAGDPEQPSDPTPDTAAESADPSGTGERVDR